jgi:hypothetical protein
MNQYLQAVLLLDVTIDKPVRLSLLVAAYRAVPVYALLPMPLAHHIVKDAQNSYKNCEHGKESEI